MVGTLLPPQSTPLRLSAAKRFSFPGRAGSDRKMSLPCKSHCKAAIHAFADTMPSVVEMRRPTSLYEVLRVNRNASQVEIKTAYRSLAKMYHPDSSESADGRDFIQIHKAYATLSDPAARELYDLSLCAAAAASGGERRPFRYSTETGYHTGYYTTRRWETDQCW